MDIARMYGVHTGAMLGLYGLNQGQADAPGRRDTPPPGLVEARAMPVQAQAPVQTAPKPVSLDDTLAEVNAELLAMGSSLKFTFDEASARRLVQVVDTETGETIRQMPSKEMLAIARALENRQGLMLSERA